MPEGWNPSDDSEDDYRPEKGSRKREEDDSEEEMKPKKSRRTPRRAPGTPGGPRSAAKATVKAEREGKVVDVCFICKKEVMITCTCTYTCTCTCTCRRRGGHLEAPPA